MFVCIFTDYFVLWDEKIINHLMHGKDKLTSKSRELLQKLELPVRNRCPVNKAANFSREVDNKWLSKAQDLML
jgi:hypothetical protein